MKRLVKITVEYSDTGLCNTHMSVEPSEQDAIEYIERMEKELPVGGRITGVFNWPANDVLEIGRVYMLNNGKCIKLEKTLDGCLYVGRMVRGMEKGKAKPYGAYMFWWCTGNHMRSTQGDESLDIITD